MALPPEAAEALDDATSPDRLTEIAETFPELQSLVAVNPSCLEETRVWILEANRSAAELYRSAQREAAPADHVASAAATEPDDAWGPSHADDGGALDEADVPTAVIAPVKDVPFIGEQPADEPATVQMSAPEPATAQMSAPEPGAPEPAAAPERTEPLPPVGVEGPREGAAPEVSGRAELPRVIGYLDALRDDPADDPWTSDRESSGRDGAWVPAGSSAVPLGAQAAQTPQAAHVAPTGHVPVQPYPASPPSGPHLAPGPDPASAPGQEPPRRRAPLLIAAGCLVLAGLLVLGVAGGALLLRPREDATPSASPSTPVPAATEAPASSSAPPTSASPTSAALVRPAPAGAADMTAIQAPSGNISCALGEDSVACSITERRLPADENCPDGTPLTVAVGAEAPALDCANPRSGGETLAYGSSAQHGEVACTSESSGMTCWNQRTGHGFTLSRSEYSTF